MTHLSDAELVRLMDGEHATPDEADRWRNHVDGCGRCATDFATIRAHSRTVSGWLARADFEADLEPARATTVLASARPAVRTADDAGGTGLQGGTGLHDGAGLHRGTRSARGPAPDRSLTAVTWLKAAAIALLVTAPLAAFPGVRGWVADQVQRVAGGPAATGEAGPATTAEGPVVRFATMPGRFTVRFEALPGRASLILGRVPADPTADPAGDPATANVAILRLSGDAEPVVAAAGLRIRGGATGAVHRLALPAAVEAVDVLAGDEVIHVTGEELDRGRRVEVGR